MDPIALFSAVRPAAPADDDLDTMYRRARDRVAAAYQDPPRRRRRAIAFTVAAAGLAAGAAALAVTLLAGNGARPGTSLRSFVTAAYTVQPKQDGTIIVTIKQLQDPAGLQRALAADGVPALVRYVPSRTVHGTYHGRSYTATGPACNYLVSDVPGAQFKAVGPGNMAGSPDGVFWIRPSAMPKGSVVFIQDSVSSFIDLLPNGKLPRCVPNKPSPQQIAALQGGSHLYIGLPRRPSKENPEHVNPLPHVTSSP